MLSRNLLVGASAVALAFGIAGAQAAPKKHHSKQQPTAHSAASLACSQQANEKGLHGKARRKFREACKRQYKGGYGYAPKQGGTYQAPLGQAYKPMQDQGYKAPQQGQGFQGKSQQGQGNNLKKWWQ